MERKTLFSYKLIHSLQMIRIISLKNTVFYQRVPFGRVPISIHKKKKHIKETFEQKKKIPKFQSHLTFFSIN